MGLTLVVPWNGPPALGPLLDRLGARGIDCTVVMIDRSLWPPGRPFPDVWAEARLHTAAGMVTLARRSDGVAVVVFGNADERLQATQRAIATALRE